MHTPMTSLDEVLESFNERFSTDEIAKVAGKVVQYHLDDKNPQTEDHFWVTPVGGVFQVTRGQHPNPDCVIDCDLAVYIAIHNGQTTCEKAFMEKKLRLPKGPQIAVKMNQLFKL